MIPTEYLNKSALIWQTVRATPVLMPFAGIIMMLLNPGAMACGFTSGIFVSAILNVLLKIIFKWLHFKINGTYTGTTLFMQGLRPIGARDTGNFLEYPPIKSTSWGMPSGHSQLAWYFVGFLIGYLFIWLPHQFTITHKIMATFISIVLALIISFSRIYVDHAHTIGQVIVGGVFGFILGLLTLIITRFIAIKYLNEHFTTEIDMMAVNNKSVEDAQNAANDAVNNAVIAAQKAESAKNTANDTINSNNKSST